MLPLVVFQEERPDKATHETEITELNATMDTLKEERRKVQDKIDESMNDPVSKAKLQEARGKMNILKTQKNALIEEKKALRAKLDVAKTQKDKLIKDKKDATSNVKFKSVDEINKAIKELQRMQETTTMTLNEEKKLLKEMDSLQSSKRFVADIISKDAGLDGIKEQQGSVKELINAKDKEIDGFSKQIDETMTIIKAINEVEGAKRETIQELFKEREDIKKKMDETAKERDSCRAVFREVNNKFYNFQRAIRAQKKMQYEEEKARYEAERTAENAVREAEEAKKIPYEEEQALCDYLANFLSVTYLGKNAEEKSEKKVDVVAVKDDPFAGLMPSVKKTDDDAYFGKGKGKKKRVRAAKKQDSAAGPFSLSVDMFDQFGLVSLSPPTKAEDVEKSVNALREKKEWYKLQPRGSVPTAQDVRKANQKAAAKSTPAADGETKKPKAPGSFSLSNDDFVPLGVAATSASVNSSWGQKAPEAQEAL
jgi:uncharacterized coiled-coil DUF342 family protein